MLPNWLATWLEKSNVDFRGPAELAAIEKSPGQGGLNSWLRM
jgi:hypothetical protein